MAKIKHINAREILNSAGFPALEVTVTLNDGISGIASCPNGNTIGAYEAFNLVDNDDKRYSGRGVLKAVNNINTIISPKLCGMDPIKQQQIDRSMIDLDSTQNKNTLGANAMLTTSMAVARAAASSSVLPLFLYLRSFISSGNSSDKPMKIPTPLFTLFSSCGNRETGIDFEEFIAIPASSKTYSESLQMGAKLYSNLGKMIKQNNIPLVLGLTDGFAPNLPTNIDALLFLQRVIGQTKYQIGLDVFLGIDSRASVFYKGQQYAIHDKNQPVSTKMLIAYYQELIKQFHILYLEDPLSENDWVGWTDLVEKTSQNALIVGDDLTATNLYRLQMAIEKKTITGIVVKPSQIGTVIEALAVVEVARTAGLKIIVAQRAQETNDDFIADFAVAVSADYVKFGSPIHGEHTAKYNRLLQIDEQLKLLKSAIK